MVTSVLEELKKRGIGTYLFPLIEAEDSRKELAYFLSRSEPLLWMDETDYMARMLGYFRVGDLEKSLNAVNSALNLNLNNPTVLNCKIYLLAALGRGYEAIDTVDRYATLQKQSSR